MLDTTIVEDALHKLKTYVDMTVYSIEEFVANSSIIITRCSNRETKDEFVLIYNIANNCWEEDSNGI